MLDPRILYEGMKSDYADDNILTNYLESAKASLHRYFQENYAGKNIITPSVTAASTPRSAFGASQSQNGSPQKVNFTARYKKHPSIRRDQLEEYFKLPCEDFDTCDPISWWLGRCSQFLDVFVFARDLLAIPGEDFIDVFHCQCQ